MARRARQAGAEFYRNMPVTGLTQYKDDSWTVHTEHGDIACEIVVIACGYRVNEVGSMMDVHHPVTSMEHQCFLTEAIPEIEALDHRVPLLRCSIDPRSFTTHANEELCALKAIEDYQNEFRFHLPHEHRHAGRPMKTTPLTPIFAAEGAECGVVNGWERVAYFKPSEQFKETHGYHFNETFDVVGAEVNAVKTAVELTEVNGFNRIEITGAGARDWLDANLPEDGSVSIRSLTNDYTILVLAGPRARDVLSAVSRENWSARAFPWLSVRKAFIGIAPAVVMSVSCSGELAYEIPCAQCAASCCMAGLAKCRRSAGTTAIRISWRGIHATGKRLPALES